MIPKYSKNFNTKFGVDEEVEVVDKIWCQGSQGYISSIKIDRNGIFYDVVLIKVKVRKEIKDKPNFNIDIYKPTGIIAADYMLKSLRKDE